METRRFGSTGHLSAVAILGAAAFGDVEQSEADDVMEQVVRAGVNHIDVAPSYGDAELRLGPWLARERDRFFLGCKTTERSKHGAASELRRSLKRLQVDYFDLFQIHAITSLSELDEVTRPGGALEALIEAQKAGLIGFVGITGHGVESPAVFIEALRRYDFDSVMFPVNSVQYANPRYRQRAEELIRRCRTHDIGVMIIKSIAKAPWGQRHKTHSTWYQPMNEIGQIQQAVDFVLSYDITGLCTAGDTRVLPLVLQACENFTPMTEREQETLIRTAAENYEPLFE